ncbi:MAG: DUF192 domain-containing protein [Bacteroidetes bacterium]|nr:DUF192 domain-containing protein [Bacteroidota bacterium]MBU1719477.1 DUF192 domain-containing protein [Bacteroidota bacterium]
MSGLREKSRHSKKKNNIRLIILLVLLGLSLSVYFVPFGRDKRVVDSSGDRQIDTTGEMIDFPAVADLVFLKSDSSVIRKIRIAEAKTEVERNQGLMYRTSMPEDAGMLFYFDRSEIQGFWMKNTLIPLDIIFLNAGKEIVKIHKYAQPGSEESLSSEKPAMYVVEVNAGFCDKHGITEGDVVMF